MRKVFRTTIFKHDYRQVLRSSRGIHIRETLTRAVELFASDQPLPAGYPDHPLKGSWQGHREYHFRPDPLLIYRKNLQPDSFLSLLPWWERGKVKNNKRSPEFGTSSPWIPTSTPALNAAS